VDAVRDRIQREKIETPLVGTAVATVFLPLLPETQDQVRIYVPSETEEGEWVNTHKGRNVSDPVVAAALFS
jgi:hypothetical protein